ncbi:MAG: hypothetical protein ACI81V_000485, partial [Lentimonas sp.]
GGCPQPTGLLVLLLLCREAAIGTIALPGQ